jgi:hypothetical protein
VFKYVDFLWLRQTLHKEEVAKAGTERLPKNNQVQVPGHVEV